MPKKENVLNIDEFKKEMVNICRENSLYPPDQIAVLPEFPRVNTKIQKYKIRQDLKDNKLKLC
jgi:hypothetical protein